MNHPDKNRIADGKLAQLRRARSVGLDVPASLVTNDPEPARVFCADHPAGVIVKPVVSGRLIIDGAERIFFTSLLDTDAQRHLERLGPSRTSCRPSSTSATTSESP